MTGKERFQRERLQSQQRRWYWTADPMRMRALAPGHPPVLTGRTMAEIGANNRHWGCPTWGYWP